LDVSEAILYFGFGERWCLQGAQRLEGRIGRHDSGVGNDVIEATTSDL
jgi:hypothetical protein